MSHQGRGGYGSGQRPVGKNLSNDEYL
jgi:hypothetical protein